MNRAKSATTTRYNETASDYESFRRPGSETLEQLMRVLSTVSQNGYILSLGCGTGFYEEELGKQHRIIGLDISTEMLKIARSRIKHIVHGDMLNLPFASNSVSGVMCIQSMHHIGAKMDISENTRVDVRKRALIEIWRVLNIGPLVIVHRDPSQNSAVWFLRYFPEALERKLVLQPSVNSITRWMQEIGFEDITAIPVNDLSIHGFYNPESPFYEGFRKAYSDFDYLNPDQVSSGLRRLRKAISDDTVMQQIEINRRAFREIGGDLFVIHGLKVQ